MNPSHSRGGFGHSPPASSDRPPPSRPMLPPNPPPMSNIALKNRTSHACDRCRLMRTKCSGGRRCTKCIKDDAVCAYGDRKRERNKKDLVESAERITSLEEENAVLVDALRGVVSSPAFQNDRHKDVRDLVLRYADDDPTETSQGSSSQSQSLRGSGGSRGTQQRQSVSGPHAGEEAVSSTIGSPGAQGELRKIVDLDFGMGASGYVGKMSEISWMQRAREYLSAPPGKSRPEHSASPYDPNSLVANDFSYFMDNENILAVDEDHVDVTQIPPLEVALVLSEAYFHCMQGAFHFVLREPFLDALNRFPQERRSHSWAERRWLSTANLIWAIGAKWLNFSKLDRHGFWESHLVYYARARSLGLDHRVLFDHPDVERVQGIGLLAFFLFMNGSISRAYTTLGHALRHATALALHLRVTDPDTSRLEQENRCRTWYSLYSLEILLSETTGRPKSISLEDITVHLSTLENSDEDMVDDMDQMEDTISPSQSRKVWLEFLHGDRNLPQGMTGGVVPWRNFAFIGQHVSSAHFPHHVRLCEISDRIGMSLYRGLQNQPWSETQGRIAESQSDLREWLEHLPEELNIHSQAPADTDPRAKIELAMYFHSVQMILYRVCLCEIRIPDQSERSLEFNRSSARACVHAAMSMLSVMPDSPSAHEAYQLLPWWTLLHYVTQATVVLLLELCLDSQHFPNEIPDIVRHLRKAMAYLFCLAEGSLSAYRAWRICRGLLSDIAERYGNLNVADIAMEAPQPFGWTDQDDITLHHVLS